jgi:hypothetical protein
MWGRIRNKVLTKRVVNIGHVDAQLVDIVDRCAETAGQMQAIIDKCSCGSPRIGLSKKNGGIADSDLLVSLNRKLDVGSGCSPSSVVKNEYTKPIATVQPPGTTDERRRTAGQSGTNAAHTGTHGRRDEADNNARNAQFHRQSPSVNSSPRITPHSTPSRQKSNEREQCRGHVVGGERDTNIVKDDKFLNKHEKDKNKDNSNYTSLNYDVNYVRVSPPKMTRRLKRSDGGSSEPEVKLTREAQLQARRMAAAVDAGSMLTDIKYSREPRAPAPGPEISVQPVPEEDKNKRSSATTNDGQTTIDDVFLPTAESAMQTRNDSETVAKESVKTKESDYMSLSDLQSQLAAPQSTLATTTTSVSATSSADEIQKLDLGNKLDVICRDDGNKTASAVKTTIYSDGENSFLQFTFTVKLENDAINNKPSPAVVAGTVNIVQPNSSRDPEASEDVVDGETVNPIVTIGLQQGGIIVNRFGTTDDCITSSNQHTLKVFKYWLALSC